ncbi:hypothetical protein D3C85_1053520 [compost metagenome]
MGATEVLQGFLRVQYLLVQRFGLGLARGAVSRNRLLGLQLLEFFVQALFLIAQRGAVSQCLQGRRLNVRQVDGQARDFEAFASEAIQDQLHGFDPLTVFVQRDAMFAQRQAEQCTVEQAHQAFDVLLRELFTQAGVAVVVGVVELLLDRLQALFQIPQTLIKVFGAELARLRQRTGQFVVGILGGQQLLFKQFDVIHQREAMLEDRQLAKPALDASDLTLQAHQLLSAATLIVLQRVLLIAIVLGLDRQLFLACAGVVRPGAEQGVQQRRDAVQFATQDIALGNA